MGTPVKYLNGNWKIRSMNCLCKEECLILKSSLIILQTENHFQEVFLWGKIIGTKSYYYVCYGYHKDVLNSRIFYYSNNGIDWKLMPEIIPVIQNLLRFCSNHFTGDPAFLSDVIIGSSSIFSLDENSVKKVKEEDRLAATVFLISQEADILPRGALYKHENGIITVNKNFQGLSKEESKDLHSYVHYRKPKYKWNSNLSIQVDYSYEKDFLDTIGLDIPKLCWNMQFEDGGKTVTLQHLQWIGMTFTHKLGTTEYKSIYIGNGIKNIDAPFML